VAVVDDRGAPPPPAEYDRQPPQDVQAEQSVLGGMLLSKDAIADVIEVLKSDDFYRPAHQLIYDVVLDLYGRGEPADPVTVSAELTRTGQIMRVGGTPYLHTLISSVPTAANAGYYAQIVAERAVLRRLIEAGTRIVQLGYGAATDSGDIDDVVDRAQAAVYDVTERRTSEDYVRLEQLLQGTMDEIDAIATRGGASLGVPTGFAELDQITNGLHPAQMITVAARPGMGKSTLALDVARSCSIKNHMPSVIFSLEMSKSEITMRLLSAEAKVALHKMRSGQMNDDDWARLARRMGEVADAPLYIDDSPNLTMMEIRAKARRLKQRHDLRLVVVDYLQLLTSGRRVESRQQEVSEFSRSLKLLAKELELPVMALSQLNRGPEQRTDKKPMLADLRECLTGDTLIARCDTGERVPIRDLVGQSDVPVWSVDEHLKLRRSTMHDIWATGRKPVHRVTLASGRSLTATANHPLLTVHGWVPVDGLVVGDHLAVARELPEPSEPTQLRDAEVIMMAHLIGDGCTSRSPVYYCSADEANLQVVEQAAKSFGVDTRRSKGRGVTYIHFPMRQRATHGVTNPLYDWLDAHGLRGECAPSKRVPAAVVQSSGRQVRLFLRHLWATDGSVTVARSGRVRIYYGTTSRGLADDVQALLLRLGVSSRLRRTTAPASPAHHQGWTVDVSGAVNQRRFITEVGVHGERSKRCAEALARLDGVSSNPNVGCMPREAWDYVRKVMLAQGMTGRALAQAMGMSYCGTTLYKVGLSRERMARIAAVLPDPHLVDLAASDVDWDRIVSIEPMGEQDVYDALVPGTHSFLANDVVSHNSGAIEQDSDMVLLLHREDMYERESPRAGEADIIIAKHRNGPTGSVTVAFQGHYSRFVDMQQG
jgi:replicative DNA helicase